MNKCTALPFAAPILAAIMASMGVPSDSRKVKEGFAREAIRFWSTDAFASLLLRTLLLALTGHLKLDSAKTGPAAAAAPSPEAAAASSDMEVDDPASNDEDEAAAAVIDVEGGCSDDRAAGAAETCAGIVQCLLGLQSHLTYGKPVGGWTSGNLKSLRQAVKAQLGLRCVALVIIAAIHANR